MKTPLLAALLTLIALRTLPNPIHAQPAVDRASYLERTLALNAGQATQAAAILRGQAASESELRGDLDAAKKALQSAIEARDTSAIDDAAARIGLLQARKIASAAKAEADFYALLTPDQRSLYGALGASANGELSSGQGSAKKPTPRAVRRRNMTHVI